jgi:hypothetical protein
MFIDDTCIDETMCMDDTCMDEILICMEVTYVYE